MEDKLKQIKRDLLVASHKAGACHIGSALSCADILVELFYKEKIKPEDFMFGKASGVGAYYAILADLGYFPKHKLADYLKQYPLPSVEVPGITASFGSVGHALSVATGIALSRKMSRDLNEFTVLLSDGDCQEGSTLEAALFINHHKLTRLRVIVDNNKIIACGFTDDILKMQPVWNYLEECIHNLDIRDTVKGAGVSFMENDYHWHYRNLTDELLGKALNEIEHGYS